LANKDDVVDEDDDDEDDDDDDAYRAKFDRYTSNGATGVRTDFVLM